MKKLTCYRAAFSLLELLAVVTIIAVLAAAVVPRISISGVSAKEKLREQQITDLNKGLERYRFEFGSAVKDLSDLVSAGYFPDGLPVSPVTNKSYSIDKTSGRIDRSE